MANWYVVLVFAFLLVHASARNVPGETKAIVDEAAASPMQVTANVGTTAAAPGGAGVKDKKCLFGGLGGWAGVGGFTGGVLPTLGGLGGGSGLGGLGGLGGGSGMGKILP